MHVYIYTISQNTEHDSYNIPMPYISHVLFETSHNVCPVLFQLSLIIFPLLFCTIMYMYECSEKGEPPLLVFVTMLHWVGNHIF